MNRFSQGRLGQSRLSAGRFSQFGGKLGQATAFNPETALIQNASVAVGGVILGTDVDRTLPIVMAADFTGLDGSSGGLIAEFGGSTIGAYCGFRADGSFIARCGQSSEIGPPFPSDKCAYALAQSGEIAGDGTLVVEFVPGTPITTRTWWNGELLSELGEGLLGSGTWAGGDPGGYMVSQLAIVAGEIADPVVNYSSVSGMRVYAGQTVSA